MFGFNLNPNAISSKAAALALVSNAVEGVKHIPGRAISGVATLKTAKAEKAMKSKMAVVSQLNEAEKVIADLNARGVTGVELDTAIQYADMLRAKL